MTRVLSIVVATIFWLAGAAGDVHCQDRTAAAKAPRRGGVLREIIAAGPRVLGYTPEMGPGDSAAAMPAVERLMEYNEDKELVPFLCESVNVAKDLKSITFKLRKGIKFHDESEMNADAVAWNFQLSKDTKRLQFDDRLTKIEVVDNHTVKLDISRYSNQLIYAWGWTPILSKQAFEKAGGGNIEKSKEWARVNVVGTGPFKLAEYKRDNYIRWARNESYWQPGKPYLDGIYVRYIPDPVTASALMQTKDADMWYGAPVQDVASLEKKGFSVIAFGLPRLLYLNTKDAASAMQNQKVREAVEYALDKPAIARALGFGHFTPIYSVSPPGEWGYDPAYQGRLYNPARAKQLLAEAGYPKGVKVKLLTQTTPPYPDEAQAVKRYLDEVGIFVDTDLAEPGRFFQSIFRNGWADIALYVGGRSANGLVNFQRQFGPEPLSNFESFRRPPELIALSEKALALTNPNEQKEATRQLVRMMADKALVIPLYLAPVSVVHQPWAHVTWLKSQMVTRYTADEWLDGH